MDLASINVAPMRGNRLLNGATFFVFQYGRDLERYVEEFLNICHQATSDDVCLMEGFRCGLDDDLQFIMPVEIPVGPAKLHQLCAIDERVCADRWRSRG